MMMFCYYRWAANMDLRVLEAQEKRTKNKFKNKQQKKVGQKEYIGELGEELPF